MSSYSHAADANRDASQLMQSMLRALDAAKAGHPPTVQELEYLMKLAKLTACHAAMTLYAVGRDEMHADRRAPEKVFVGDASRITVTAPVRAPRQEPSKQEAWDTARGGL